MSPDKLFSAFMIVVLTLISGFADAQGALWAAKIWDNDRLNTDALLRATLGFGVGIGVYFLTIRFLRNVGIVSPEIQTTLYMLVMIVTVALVNRDFFRWQTVDQAVALALVGGVVWLAVRTGGA